MFKIAKSIGQEIDSVWLLSTGNGGGDYISFWGDKNLVRLTTVMVAYICQYHYTFLIH